MTLLKTQAAYNINAPDTATVFILDDDNSSPNATVVTIYASVPETLEADPSQPGIFKVVLTGALKTKLNVHYMITGTAQNGIDYDEISGTVTIPAG